MEVNPGLFTVGTFPFLFGIMYGDVGHGLFILSLGIALLFLNNPKINFLSPLKFLFIVLGFFSIYCGLIYNEFFSIPLVMNSSCYSEHQSAESDCVYPLGLDWIWA